MKAEDCDVLVVGGGCAGIGASCGAASRGARVVLVERDGFWGGLASSAGVGTICGLYLRDAAGPRPVGQGFAHDWADRLMHTSGTGPVSAGQALYVLPYEVSRFQALAGQVVREAALVQPLLHATLVAARARPGSGIEAHALVAGKDMSIHAAAAIDATGDATLVRMTGGATEDVSATQAPGVVLTLDRPVPELAELGTRLATLRAIHHAAQQGRLPPDCATASFVPNNFARDPARLKMTLSVPTDPGASYSTRLEAAGREMILAVCALLGTTDPCRHARLADQHVQVGRRATFRAVGQVTLSRKDVRTGRKRDDGVARGAWPMEKWSPGATGPEMELTPVGEFYDVPLGSLRAAGLDRVFVAGRCLSADAHALASARVMGTSLDTGYAAGVAAAQLVKTGDARSAIELLRAKEQGSRP